MSHRKSNVVGVIFGRKQSGKSYLANQLAAFLHGEGRRILVVDPSASFNFCGRVIRPVSVDALRDLGGRSAIVRPESDGQAFMLFEWAWYRGDLFLIVDDVELYFAPNQADPFLMRMVRYGRHRGISVVGISQRPAGLDKNLVAQADIRILFQLTEPNDLLYVRKWCNVAEDDLRSLPARKFLRFPKSL